MWQSKPLPVDLCSLLRPNASPAKVSYCYTLAELSLVNGFMLAKKNLNAENVFKRYLTGSSYLVQYKLNGTLVHSKVVSCPTSLSKHQNMIICKIIEFKIKTSVPFDLFARITVNPRGT